METEKGRNGSANTDRDADRATTGRTPEDRLEANKRLAAHLAEELINNRNVLVGEDHIGLENTVGRVGWLLTALPDARVTVDWQVAEGDWVVTGATVRGTHLGELEGLTPTGKAVTMRAIVREEVVNGEVVQAEVFADLLAALQQVGARLTPRPGA
jgi:predicted ester cyclase